MGRGRAPCCEKVGLNKGSWTPVEDMRLVTYIQKFGHGNWRALPKHAGLLRCGKSCRLRWINYLRPDIKRGNFSKEEEDTIINLHALLGNKWSKIASYLPGRTDNEIKNVWNTHLKKRLIKTSNELQTPSPSSSASIPCSSSDQSEAKTSTSCDGETDDYNRTVVLPEFESLNGGHDQEVHQEEKIEIVPDYDIDIGELVIFDEMLDIPVENNSSCSMNFEEKQENENGNESKKWLAYLEKELDLWGGEDKQEHENEEIVGMESDPVLSYFQRGPSSPPSPLDSFMNSNVLTQ